MVLDLESSTLLINQVLGAKTYSPYATTIPRVRKGRCLLNVKYFLSHCITSPITQMIKSRSERLRILSEVIQKFTYLRYEQRSSWVTRLDKVWTFGHIKSHQGALRTTFLLFFTKRNPSFCVLTYITGHIYSRFGTFFTSVFP